MYQTAQQKKKKMMAEKKSQSLTKEIHKILVKPLNCRKQYISKTLEKYELAIARAAEHSVGCHLKKTSKNFFLVIQHK